MIKYILAIGLLVLAGCNTKPEPYGKYPSWESYQQQLMDEMYLSWYIMQQPKNHGVLQSHGAPNF